MICVSLFRYMYNRIVQPQVQWISLFFFSFLRLSTAVLSAVDGQFLRRSTAGFFLGKGISSTPFFAFYVPRGMNGLVVGVDVDGAVLLFSICWQCSVLKRKYRDLHHVCFFNTWDFAKTFFACWVRLSRDTGQMIS